MPAPYVAVIGPADATAEESRIAEEVGRRLAQAGAVVVSGGLGGVMRAACRGASVAGGVTVGLLPGKDRAGGNEHLAVTLPTGLGELRNGLVVNVSDAVIAVGGGWGTLSEIALAMRSGTPVITIRSWKVASPSMPGLSLDESESPEDAVDRSLAALGWAGRTDSQEGPRSAPEA